MWNWGRKLHWRGMEPACVMPEVCRVRARQQSQHAQQPEDHEAQPEYNSKSAQMWRPVLKQPAGEMYACSEQKGCEWEEGTWGEFRDGS